MKNKNIECIIIIVIFLFTIAFMTVGFSLYNKTLSLSGNTTIIPDGKIKITNVTKGTMTKASANPTWTDDTIYFNLSFTVGSSDSSSTTYSAVFYVTVQNDSSYDYLFVMPDYPISISKGTNTYDSSYVGYTISDISVGDKIPSGSTVNFTVTVNFHCPKKNETGTFQINGDYVQKFSEDTSAHIIASIDDSQVGDLTGNNEYAQFSITVINTYNVSRSFTLFTDDTCILIKGPDKSDTASYTIDANTEQTFTFFASKVSNAEYYSNTRRVNIKLLPDGLSAFSAGRVTVLVDQNASYDDITPPTISNVTTAINNNIGSVTVTWEGTDDVLVDHYVVIVFNENGTEVRRITTTNDNTTLEVTGLSEGTYYFVVTGVDNSNNTATASQINNATTASGYASKSDTQSYKWVYTVTYNVTNITAPTSGLTVNRGETYTGTITAGSNYNLPGSITVTMGGDEITPEYSSSTGTITIKNVTRRYNNKSFWYN